MQIGILTDKNGNPAGNAGWITAFDLDFTGIGSTGSDITTTYTYGGVTFTRINTGSSNTIIPTSGQGLIWYFGSAGSDWYNNITTAPALTVPFSAYPVGMNTPMRMSMRVSSMTFPNIGGGANAHLAALGFRCPSMVEPNSGNQAFGSVRRGNQLSSSLNCMTMVIDENGGLVVDQHDSSALTYANDCIMIEAPSGLGAGNFRTWGAIYSGGYPSAESFVPQMRWLTSLFNTRGYGPISGWQILMGGIAPSTPSIGFGFTISHLKLEYKL